MKKSLVIFTRDLRIEDNRALNQAVENSDKVLPLFVFTDKQVNEQKNDYFSEHAFLFMLESLDDLQTSIRHKNGELFFYKGAYKDAIKDASKNHGINSVYISYDVTPFARVRFEEIKSVCNELEIKCHEVHNHFLAEPGSVLTESEDMYKVFTPFKQRAQSQYVEEVRTAALGDEVLYKTSEFLTSYADLVERPTIDMEFRGGRKAGRAQLDEVQELANYKRERDFVAREGTSKLSPHMKFGTISPREFYWFVAEKFGTGHSLINELYWRDFYAHIADAYPYVFSAPFNKKYEHLEWQYDEDDFNAWCSGRTGYPIVDAAMRQLNTTGWMHNRARMIVASFLTKHLRIDWRYGERYFAQTLVDYDPATNNGSWQWAASTGADSQPYFRIFNPWLQQEKFDEDAEYIKKYVSELRGLSAKEIHNYHKREEPVDGYVLPIVDHKEARTEALAMFKKV